jgi:gluconolactonase
MTISRRAALGVGMSRLATPALGQMGQMQMQPAAAPLSQHDPNPLIRTLDPSFNRYRLALAGVERLGTGFRSSEGPVRFGDGRYLLWSDIPNNRLLRWDEATGRIGVFRAPSNNSNGNARDRQGRLVTCEHQTRRVTRTAFGGS